MILSNIHKTCINVTSSTGKGKCMVCAAYKLCLMSLHSRFHLPFLLFPSTSITITLLHTYSSSLLITCLTTLINFHALSLIFLPISLPLRFFISNFVQLWNAKHTSQHPHFRHIQLLSTFFTAKVSAPYIIAGLTTVLFNSP